MMSLLRKLRHGIRVRISFLRNYLFLRQFCARIRRDHPGKRMIAVMLLEHLGDIVACEPVVRYLKEQDPDAFIVWGVKRAYRELVESNPNIDRVLVLHCLSERLMIANSGIFDSVFDLHLSDRYCSLCRRPLRRRSPSPIGLSNYFDHGSILSSFSLSAGLPPLDDSPRLYIPAEAALHVDRLDLPGRFVVVSCTSNNPDKDWPAEKWRELTARITAEQGLPVVEIGLTSVISPIGNQQYHNLCGKLSILESAEVIRRSALFIGIDSGPAHLANAVGTRGVLLMGSYLGFREYMPFSGLYANGWASILHAAGPASIIPVERVLGEIGAVWNSVGFREPNAV